jgi:hypothetical protein
VDGVWADALNARPMVWEAIEAFLRTNSRARPRHVGMPLQLFRRVLFDEAFRNDYTHALSERIRAAAAGAGVSLL